QKRLSMSQGYTVITNDMDGKIKSQKVYSESTITSGSPISKVDYFYNVDENGKIYNNVPTIDSNGVIKENSIGVDYNVVNDFRQSKSDIQNYGADINIGSTVYWVIP